VRQAFYIRLLNVKTTITPLLFLGELGVKDYLA